MYNPHVRNQEAKQRVGKGPDLQSGAWSPRDCTCATRSRPPLHVTASLPRTADAARGLCTPSQSGRGLRESGCRRTKSSRRRRRTKSGQPPVGTARIEPDDGATGGRRRGASWETRPPVPAGIFTAGDANPPLAASSSSFGNAAGFFGALGIIWW